MENIKKIKMSGESYSYANFFLNGLSFQYRNESIYKTSITSTDTTHASGTLNNGVSFTIEASSTDRGQISNILELDNKYIDTFGNDTSWASKRTANQWVEIIFDSPINIEYICITFRHQTYSYNIRKYFIYECFNDTDTLIGGGFLGLDDINKFSNISENPSLIQKSYFKILPLCKVIKDNINYQFELKTKNIIEGDFGLTPLYLPDLSGYQKLIFKDNFKIQKPLDISYPYNLITIKDIPFNTELFDWGIPLFTPQTTNYRFLLKFNDEEKYYYFKSNTVLEEFIGNDYSIIPAYTGSTSVLFRTALGNIKNIKEIKKLTIKYYILDNTQTFTDITFNIIKSLILNDVKAGNTITIKKEENKLSITSSLLSQTAIINWYEEKIEDFPDIKFMAKMIDLSSLNLSDKFIYDSESKSIKLNKKQIEAPLNETTSEYEIDISSIINWRIFNGQTN